MELMEKVVAECKKHKNEKDCKKCKMYFCCPNDCERATDWDIEAIRRALGTEVDGAVVGEEKSCTRVDGAVESVVEEIAVPKKIDMSLLAMPTPVENAIKINQIINCLEQIKEVLK